MGWFRKPHRPVHVRKLRDASRDHAGHRASERDRGAQDRTRVRRGPRADAYRGTEPRGRKIRRRNSLHSPVTAREQVEPRERVVSAQAASAASPVGFAQSISPPCPDSPKACGTGYGHVVNPIALHAAPPPAPRRPRSPTLHSWRAPAPSFSSQAGAVTDCRAKASGTKNIARTSSGFPGRLRQEPASAVIAALVKGVQAAAAPADRDERGAGSATPHARSPGCPNADSGRRPEEHPGQAQRRHRRAPWPSSRRGTPAGPRRRIRGMPLMRRSRGSRGGIDPLRRTRL